MSALDELKLRDNTLVIFTSDNGPETLNRYPNAWRSHGSPGPLHGMKLWLYEGGIRVPGIVRWPGAVQAGQTIEEPVCSLDLLPTFCRLAGVAVPQDRMLDGQDISPLLCGEGFQRRTPLFWHYFRALGGHQAALRDGKVVVLGAVEPAPSGRQSEVEQYSGLKTGRLASFEAYQLAEDLSQQHDLLAEDSRAAAGAVGALKKKYKEVQEAGPVWDLTKTGSAGDRKKKASKK